MYSVFDFARGGELRLWVRSRRAPSLTRVDHGPSPRLTPGDADSVFKITQRGSTPTGNIRGVAAKYGVEITSSGVTLDLSGLTVGNRRIAGW
jgi:hypothetical protein